MPWKEKNIMNLKTEFVIKSLCPPTTFRALCKEYGISKTTGYKWKNRFLQNGIKGLNEKSRKPHFNPNQTTEDVVCEIIKIKNAHKDWGPKKIRELYTLNHPYEKKPSLSTFVRILTKVGLVEHKKKRKQRTTERIVNRIDAQKPNDVWTVDFKGWWYTSDNEKCEPLTVRDEYSKYILCIKSLQHSNTKEVKLVFEDLFRIYGLPKIIKSDNGPPFASTRSTLGLTRLSVWWLSLGIMLDRITPGKPYENGAHERMHRDIKRELQGHISGGIKEHQVVFDVWRNEYNNERPHEALNMQTPQSVYTKSKTLYQGTPDEIIYPMGFIRRIVGDRGFISFVKRRIFIGNAFYKYHLGLKELSNNTYEVWFDNLRIGEIDLKTINFIPVDKIQIDKNDKKE